MGMPIFWRHISGYEGLYSVSSSGQIYSHLRKKLLKLSPVSTGYHSVELYKNGFGKRLLVHRLVALAFIANPQNKPQINHVDENKTNNNICNLEWVTAKENMNHGEAAKTRHSKIDYSKEVFKINAKINGKKVAKPVVQLCNSGNVVKVFESAAEAKRVLGINASHISETCTGKRKSAGGFDWKFKKGV